MPTMTEYNRTYLYINMRYAGGVEPLLGPGAASVGGVGFGKFPSCGINFYIGFSL